jgi:hypothetical protein
MLYNFYRLCYCPFQLRHFVLTIMKIKSVFLVQGWGVVIVFHREDNDREEYVNSGEDMCTVP